MLHTDVGIAINTVLTLSKKVNINIQIIADSKIRIVLALRPSDNQPPKITGITGSTQGASTDNIQARNAIRRIIIPIF